MLLNLIQSQGDQSKSLLSFRSYIKITERGANLPPPVQIGLNNRLSSLSSYFSALNPQPKYSSGLIKKRSLVTLVLSFMNKFEISNEMFLFCMIKHYVSSIHP